MKNLLNLAIFFTLAFQLEASQIVGKPPTRVAVAPEIAEKYLIYKADPVIKSKPMAGRATGTVVMTILIGKDGSVRNPRVISGPKLLQQPALDAVRKYRYRPYLLNNQPIEMVTKVSIRFVLN